MKDPLYIAEKPSMATAIAKNLPGPHKRGEGFIETGAGKVTWAVGHLLGQAPPEEYDEKYKKWNYNDLPILPTAWKLEISSGKSKQMGIIKSLLKTCSDVVNAGDPGREGQLIVDEILEFFGNKKPVWRLLLNSLDAATIKKALANLEPNANFKDLYEAALGRQRADWMVGMNLTRAYTLLGRQKGYQSVLSVGRVQTPTLAIVVRREEEIEKFVPQTYYNLLIGLEAKPLFKAKWTAPQAYTKDPPDSPVPDWLDDLFRVSKKDKAEAIMKEVPKGTKATVVAYSKNQVQEAPPMPFELSDVQSKMNAKFGASVSDVLEACQNLYEKGYASYPRTDCVYLPTSQHPEAPQIFSAIASGLPALSSLASQADPALLSAAWNDAKLGEHHAIIPTAVAADMTQLSPLEKNVYDAIARRYLAQFFPPSDVDKVQAELEAGQTPWRWKVNGRTVVNPGWRVVYGQDADEADEDDDKSKKDETDNDSGALPFMKVGDVFDVRETFMTEMQTKPPPRYTEGTLMQAMKHVDRLVTDPNEKKMLKSVQGIGRAATRANIISTLSKRGYLEIKKKQLHPSESARMIVNAVEGALTDPGLTARWEQALDAVAQGKVSLAMFQQKQEQWIKQMINQAPNCAMPVYSGPAQPTKSAGGKSSGATKLSGSAPQKTAARSSFKGTGSGTASSGGDGKPCPKCKKPMAERTVKNGPKAGTKFLGCTGFPACNHSEWPK